GAPLGPHGALGVGPLAIGNVKHQTESGLFKQMTESKTPLRLDFRHAFELARSRARA
ncbi:MAG: methylenetetrahydromethanopterin dehydrogenase, partial [Hyphomicrobiales bacterium]|nr:methylenetetrahydromethanopterin dehydrogenase [Hyphomicrobiales bacterium]